MSDAFPQNSNTRMTKRHKKPASVKIVRFGQHPKGCYFYVTFGVDNTFTSGYRVLSASVAGTLDPGETPYNPSELLTPVQALRTMTINGAWQMGLEKERGSIEVGKYADFTIADGDILTCEKNKIAAIKILATYFEGKW